MRLRVRVYAKNALDSKCLFERFVLPSPSLHVDYLTLVNSLDFLFSDIDHVVQLEFTNTFKNEK